MANSNPSPKTRFKDGKSGNPGGKSKETVRLERENAEKALNLFTAKSTCQRYANNFLSKFLRLFRSHVYSPFVHNMRLKERHNSAKGPQFAIPQNCRIISTTDEPKSLLNQTARSLKYPDHEQDGAFSSMLIHRDPSYADAAAQAAKKIVMAAKRNN